MAKQEQHLTTARLSALIDGQLSPEEQTQSETHLQSCTACQQQLAELRQTVALLHALPQPPLPRSFVLPTAEPAIASQGTRTARPLAPITPLPRRNGWPTYVTGAVRVASTLAALIGIVFLLSGLFGAVIPVGGSTTSSGASTTSNSGPGKTTPQFVTPRTVYKGITPTATSTKGQTVTSPNSRTAPTVQQNPLQAFLDVRLIGIRAILGTILLVLGVVGFIVVARRM